MRTALERNNDFKGRTDGRGGRVERGVERESERVVVNVRCVECLVDGEDGWKGDGKVEKIEQEQKQEKRMR